MKTIYYICQTSEVKEIFGRKKVIFKASSPETIEALQYLSEGIDAENEEMKIIDKRKILLYRHIFRTINMDKVLASTPEDREELKKLLSSVKGN